MWTATQPFLTAMQALLAMSALTTSGAAANSFSDTGPYPASYGLFSTAFEQPPIPSVATDFQGHFIQHKWDTNVSHIASGYWYNSATHNRVRIDETYAGAFASSLFDYTSIDPSSGAVLNKLRTVSGGAGSAAECFVAHVADPAFPLVTADLLQRAAASFGGVVKDPYVGYAQTWNLLYGDRVPVIVYLDEANVFVGFDFWAAERRTKVVTRFFSNAVGEIDAEVFEDFPCPSPDDDPAPV